MGAPTTIQTVEYDGGEIAFNTDMPMRSLVGLMSAANEGDLEALIESMASFVTAWPLDSDPTDPEAWLDLPRTQFNDITEAVMTGLGDSGNA